MQTLEQLAKLTNSSFDGDGNIELTSVASAVILNSDLAKKFDGNTLINDNPYLTFARVLQILHAEPQSPGSIHKSATVSDNSKISQNAVIGANVIIESGVTIDENVIIGPNCVIGVNSQISKGVQLHPNVTLYKDTIIGENSIIHSGVVIGSDGFGFAPTKNQDWFKILQIGNVVIGDNVEIGANTTIDRAALGSTKINNGVKLDNLIGAAAIAGHLHIVDDVIFTGRSMVMKSVKKPGVYSSGIAAEENKKWRRNAARFRNLDELAKKVRSLEQQLNETRNNT